jgi:ATP-dependent Clp protease adaptor protein ClpS
MPAKIWQSGVMITTKSRQPERTQTGGKSRREPPWNVVLHNDWENDMVRVVLVLKKVVPGMTVKRAAGIMWTAHTNGQATVKQCHKELAELYKERLQGERLSASIEPSPSG